MITGSKSGPMVGILIMVLGMITLASTDAISKSLTDSFAVIQILWIRFIIFAGVGVFIALKKHGRQGFCTKRPVAQILRALILVTTNFMAVFTLSLMAMADVHSILAISPIIVMAVSVPLLGEFLGSRRWLAVGVGFLGVLVILRPGVGVFEPVSLIALSVAVLFSSYTVLTKIISRDDTNETTLFYTGIVGFICLTAIGPFFWLAPSAEDWAWLIIAGIGGTLAHVFIITALHFAPASTLQPFNYIMLVWATVLGFFVFNDLPDTWTLAGGSLIVLSGLYAWNRERLSNI